MVLLEIAGLGLVGLVIWVLFRAARARPEDSGLRVAAWIGAAAGIGFVLLWIWNLDVLWDDPIGTLTTVLIACLILAVVMGYRVVLKRLRDQAGR